MWKVVALICMLTPYEQCRQMDDDLHRVFNNHKECESVATVKFYETVDNLNLMSAPWNRFEVWCEHFDPVDPSLLDDYKG